MPPEIHRASQNPFYFVYSIESRHIWGKNAKHLAHAI